MELPELAGRLVAATPDQRRALLRAWLASGDAPARALAVALKQLYDAACAADPPRAAAAADALESLAAAIDDGAVAGFAAWAAGLVAMDEGRLADAVDRLQAAADAFVAAGQGDHAAAVQMGQMAALAMQGHFEDALAAGMAARALCDASGDPLTAGKIEQNLGNLHFLRHRYVEAEQLYRAARARFAQVDDPQQLAQVDNCLATALTSQHRFAEAEAIYAAAIQRAEAAGLDRTLAEIECNLGCLALYQGRYQPALDYLERSRRRYAQLGMPHELAIADQELADAYLELNLAPEAAAIYGRVAAVFAELAMPVERARALAYHGRACILLGQLERAHELLAAASALYRQVGMPVGEAIAQMTRAELQIRQGDFAAAAALLAAVEPVFAAAHAEGWRLQAGWLRGVAARRMGRLDDARTLLRQNMDAAERALVAPLVQRCAAELGLVALARGDLPAAEAAFRQAVELVEALRDPLPAEEFRMGFIGDKLTPYVELVRLCLADGTPERTAEALSYVERSRARALVDRLGGAEPAVQPRDGFEADLLARLAALRSELNWFYSQLNRPGDAAGERGSADADALQAAARGHEAAILTLLRQVQQRSEAIAARQNTFDLAALQRELGDATALVEYFWIDDRLHAFVVTGDALAAVELGCGAAEVQAALQQLHFQIGSLRHAGAGLQRHLPALARRSQQPLGRLHELLLAPILPHVAERRLAVAPQQSLHYVPFHALFDGSRYLIETREVVTVPSATLLHHCLGQPAPAPQRALLVGMPDDYAPRVADEVATIAPLFGQSVRLTGEQATRDQLRRHAPQADLLHIACHGRFRSDNPYFSALHLADGWMTVHDAYELRLACTLVTLSACETGISAVAPGDDLVGLARGFLLAGAPSLLVSLWMVDDAATAELMASFYRSLLAGARPAAALRAAQCELLASRPHPFFWAPFVLIGRW